MPDQRILTRLEAMDFIDLDRVFAPLSKDSEAVLEWGVIAGRKYGGWLSWSELLQRPRVVLLAEALSGKSEELRFQTKRLKAEGKHAYLVSIEELADSGFQSALDESDTADFDVWRGLRASGWFFLDSLDEARLNRKSFALALRRFSKELGRENLGRAFVVVTCRVSDWHGKGDRQVIKELLPIVTSSGPEPILDPDEALLGPIFTPSEKKRSRREQSVEVHPAEALIVQLVPLTTDQKKLFAQHAGLNADQFLRAVDRSGLHGMTERPGDLIDLIGYWKVHGAFGSLRDMTDEGIQRKLTEDDKHRTDADQLTLQKAREGAERLATALVLGKSFTLRAPGQDPDADLAQGALEPSKVLPDWTDAQIATLLRRGLFAPATYGRVRFHHRASQEFLAASWLRRLLAANCPVREISHLLFVDLYGVETVKPALRAVAAWLALDHPTILAEITRREPVCLIVHGDPKSLPVAARRKLLDVYARLDAKGDLNPESIDHRAVWMFSDPELATAIRSAWSINERHDFRLQLLRFIEDAAITGCVDLARDVALDAKQDDYSRIIAARALLACNDIQRLRNLAERVRAAPDKLSCRLAPELSLVLYPNYLNTMDLIDLIDRSHPARPHRAEGFAQYLAPLYRAAPDPASAEQLASGLTELYLAPRLGDEGPDGGSKRHEELAKGLAGIATAEFDRGGAVQAQVWLVRLLMAVERAFDNYDSEEVHRSLSQRIQAHIALKRELIWADVQAEGHGKRRDNPPTCIWQVGPFYGHRLWSIDIDDVNWLLEDSRIRPLEHERRVAFSALYQALFRSPSASAYRQQIEALASREPILRSDLTQFEAPPPHDPYAARRAESKLKREKQESEAKQSWRKFRDQLSRNPELLDTPSSLTSWKAGLFRLHHLTSWLKAKIGGGSSEGPEGWRALRPAFGDATAQHYCNGMRMAWRHIKPERPVYHGNGSYTTKHTSMLAVHGLAIDSAEDPAWASKLSSDDVRRATMHACYVGASSAEWFHRLMHERSAEAIEVVRRSTAVEYASEGAHSDLLVNSASDRTSVGPIAAARLLQLLKKAEPVDDITFDRAIQVLKRNRDDLPEHELHRLVSRRLEQHLRAGNEKRALGYFALYLLIAPDEASNQLCDVLNRADGEDEVTWRGRTQKWLGELFGRHYHSASKVLADVSITVLLRLVRMFYRNLPPDLHDEDDDGVTLRDGAEHARSVGLNALLARPGAEAFRALHDLASDPTFHGNTMRIRELAHGKAEADGDLVAWSEREVVAFESAGISPAKTGAELLRTVMAVLSDIAASFDQEDASSRSLLELADSEDQVQTWLVERLNERSRHRFHAHREPKVARGNEPDIVVSSTAANVQVAIEVKNGNKDWSVAQLERALTGQLARDYLRPSTRRCGVLVISLHRNRMWKRAGNVLTFERLIDHLGTTALTVSTNETGPIEVRVFGLDARARGVKR